MHQFIRRILHVVHTTSEERAECSKRWGGLGGERGFPTALGRTDVGACYTRGARSRRWCRWWRRRGRWRGGEGIVVLYQEQGFPPGSA